MHFGEMIPKSGNDYFNKARSLEKKFKASLFLNQSTQFYDVDTMFTAQIVHDFVDAFIFIILWIAVFDLIKQRQLI
jgi:hypothetical protein